MSRHGLGKRACGILLPVFSLPSAYGIGSLSKEAFEFVDFLKDAGQSYWQMLPEGPTGYGDSPYAAFSTFAGNPYFIDIEALIADGLLTKREAGRYRFGDDPVHIDYGLLYKNRLRLLRLAYERGKRDAALQKKISAFERKNRAWLKDYALFAVLKEKNGGKSWDTWEDGVRLRKRAALQRASAEYKDGISFQVFLQYLFDTQWHRLKAYANEKGIGIIGDLPIYVAFDSADTWSHPELFYLDDDRRPIEIAGCPPDDFARLGQRWGNPLYRWDVHKKTGYAWWIERFRHVFSMYDIVRIDHFRGFESYYAIDASHETAEHGVWRKGPGADLFKKMEQALGKKRVIAEDLGFLTPAVYRMMRTVGYPGMKVLQFAFYPGENDHYESEYLPYRYAHNCVVYTGTHDNETTRGWFGTLNKKDQAYTKRYLGASTDRDVTPQMMRAALSSVADTAILPMQDILGLGRWARINTPSTIGGNWCWRMKDGVLTKALAKRLRRMAEDYGRI
ncbi:MAG: 4-alpha-glucanotransferase [Lachnospiraceae bacterium]|nr:4-alpha-glucanotransferase [Lachnospiraceae bacterium]